MKLTIPVLYSQVVLFSADLKKPYNDWSDQHVRQGFAWREKSVSFAIPGEVVELEVSISADDELRYDEDADRIIVVPLDVAGGRGGEFGNVIDTVGLDIADGEYTVCFQLFLRATTDQAFAVISIIPEKSMASVVKADDALDVPTRLLMEATPAL